MTIFYRHNRISPNFALCEWASQPSLIMNYHKEYEYCSSCLKIVRDLTYEEHTDRSVSHSFADKQRVRKIVNREGERFSYPTTDRFNNPFSQHNMSKIHTTV